MSTAKPKARLYVTADLRAGEPAELTAGQIHYLVHVMRIAPGDMLALFNGRDGEWLAQAESVSRKRCTLRAIEQTRAQEPAGPADDVWLAFAPVKKTRTDFIVEKATELGAARLLPVFTEHTASSRVNIERLQAIAVEAAEQSQRLDVPDIAPAHSLNELCASWPAARILFVLDETGTGEPPVAPLAAALRDAGNPAPCGFLVGPEGGFSAAELDELRKLPFVNAVTLGPRILRAETAALAALACYACHQALAGARSGA
ncbi:MAG: 16S rRNA (uracil(1498)-N(3))-methyltransferase [Rhodospirillales bacterium]